MNNKFIISSFILIVSLAGCVSYSDGVNSIQPKVLPINEDIRLSPGFENSRIIGFCDDKVICYVYHSGYGAGMDCFRDTDLVEKYCGE